MPHVRMWWSRASLRVRILVSTAVVAAVALLVALGVYAFTLERILYSTAAQAAQSQATQISGLIVDEAMPADEAVQEGAGRGSIIQVLDSQGRVLASSGRTGAQKPLTGLRPASGQSQQVRAESIPGHDDEHFAVIARGLDPQRADGAAVLVVAAPTQSETALVRWATIGLGIIALLLLCGLLWLIDRVLRSALGRVERIRRSVTEISTTDPELRVPVPAGDDEITRLAQTMNDMLDRLARADTAQRAFLSDASHELRSPLATIRMITDTSPNGISAEATGVVSAETLRLQGLVDDLLTLAKADDRGLSLESADVDLDELVLAQARRLRAQGAVEVQLSVQAARTRGDARRLGQVIQNLADNASRHAREVVRLSCAADGASVVVHVDNDGDVIAPEHREAVFDRFTRLEQSRARDKGGSGLGLSIVRAIVMAHHGAVVAGESPEGWCRFTVTLPADQPDDDPAAPAVSR